MTGPVLTHGELRMNATGPMQLEMHRGRIISCIRHDFFKDRPKDAFLQGDRRTRMIPRPFQIMASERTGRALPIFLLTVDRCPILQDQRI